MIYGSERELGEDMQLKRELRLIDVFSVATGAMISSGIFVLPGLAYSLAGPSVFISYILAGILASTGMLSQAELVSAMPRAGGTYFYVTRSLGPAVGTVDGLLTWFSLSLKSAFALVGIGAFINLAVSINIQLVAVPLCLLFLAINVIGIKEAGRIQVVLVSFLLVLMLFYIIRGIPSVSFKRYEPFAPNGVAAIISTTGYVFVSFGGLLKVSALAEEVKDPGKTIPIGMIISLFIVSLFYTLIVFVTIGILDPEVLANSLTPLSDGAASFVGVWGVALLSVAAALAFISTANAGIMASSRYPLALSRDALMPEFLGRVNRRFKTPHFSLFITGIFMIVALFLKLDLLVKAASTVMILTYMFSCIAVIILRESRLQNYQPSFHSPLYPWVQGIGIIGFLTLILGMGRDALLISAFLILSALIVYWFYGRIRATREFALLYLIQRITAKELVSRTLESELKEIIRERDAIIEDRFDQVIEKSSIIDLEGSHRVEEFFTIMSTYMSKRLNVDAEVLYALLMDREKESSTAITNFLAIPHIIIEGENKFNIFLARCRQGIYFSQTADNIQAVFVLVGTRDERNFHLRALSAIAQIVHDPRFEERWVKAKSKEDLRDIVLLGKRRRTS
jgi:amino acid transporter/mannitol/fructose-specific phosphotransferase system IIA component (Ntr-type)